MFVLKKFLSNFALPNDGNEVGQWWCNHFGDVAQLVEQRTENPCVGGSIPSITTIRRKYLIIKCLRLSHFIDLGTNEKTIFTLDTLPL